MTTIPPDVAAPRTPEELSVFFLAIEAEIVEAGGEVTPEIADKLNTLELGEKDLVDRYASFMRHLEAKAEGLYLQAAAYAKPLTAKAKTAENIIGRLKARALEHMKVLGKTELKGDTFKMRVQQNPEALQITDAGKAHAWPSSFYKAAPLDEAKLKEHVKALGGEAYSAADEPVLLAKVSRGSHLRVY